VFRSFRWNEGHARRSELDRERKTIYPTTNLRARALSALGVERGADPHSSALAKQLRRRLGFERRESDVFTGPFQQLRGGDTPRGQRAFPWVS